jgi:hypothetical protein
MTTQNLSLYNQQAEIAQTETQYSLAKILGIWAMVALPMALLAWVVTPALIPYVNLHPGIVFWLMMIVHKPWMIPSIAVGSLTTVWPARRFRCNWMAVIIHGVEGIFLLVVVLGVVMGLA